MVVKFKRDPERAANENISEMVFLCAEDKIQLTYHTEHANIAASTRDFTKPHNWDEKGATLSWSPEMHNTFQVRKGTQRRERGEGRKRKGWEGVVKEGMGKKGWEGKMGRKGRDGKEGMERKRWEGKEETGRKLWKRKDKEGKEGKGKEGMEKEGQRREREEGMVKEGTKGKESKGRVI